MVPYKSYLKLLGFFFLILHLGQESLYAQPGEEVVVFYRGYHFLTGADTSLIDRSTNGVRTRGVSGHLSGDRPQEYVTKIKTLQRPWKDSERKIFNPYCNTPLNELVQLYTNNYKKFTEDLKDPHSQTRNIFRLAGLEIEVNPFLSTSLKAEQAIRYGSGLKLFGHDELRRYPEYDERGIPNNREIGFLDIIIVPRKDLAELGVFFVLESFARGDTKLSHHWSKKLIEEQEVIFPFFIPKKYHKKRGILQVPSLNREVHGIRSSYWLNAINLAVSTPERLDKELNLVARLSQLAASSFEDNVSRIMGRKGLQREYTSQYFYPQKRLIPDDAARMRTEIITRVDGLGRRYARGWYIDLNITDYLTNPTDRFINAYALRSFGQTAPLSLNADIGLDCAMSFEVLAIVVEAPCLLRLDILGPQTEGIFPERDDDDMDFADRLIPLADIHNHDPWRTPPKEFEKFVRALRNRNTKGCELLTMDITGQSLNPTNWDELGKFATLEDENRDDDEDAIEAARVSIEGSFGVEDWRDEEPDYDEYYESPPEDRV